MGNLRQVVAKGPRYGASGGRVRVVVVVVAAVPMVLLLFMGFWAAAAMLLFCWFVVLWPVAAFAVGGPFPAWLGGGVTSVVAVLVVMRGGVSIKPWAAGSGPGVVMVVR